MEWFCEAPLFPNSSNFGKTNHLNRNIIHKDIFFIVILLTFRSISNVAPDGNQS